MPAAVTTPTTGAETAAGELAALPAAALNAVIKEKDAIIKEMGEEIARLRSSDGGSSSHNIRRICSFRARSSVLLDVSNISQYRAGGES